MTYLNIWYILLIKDKSTDSKKYATIKTFSIRVNTYSRILINIEIIEPFSINSNKTQRVSKKRWQKK